MMEQEKITLLEETFDMDNGTLTPDLCLEEVEGYDSMAKLSLVVMMEDEFGKKLTAEDVKAFKKVADILNAMG